MKKFLLPAIAVCAIIAGLVTIALTAVPTNRVSTEKQLQKALAHPKVTEITLLNDINLTDGKPLTVAINKYVTILSETSATITQSQPGVRHFDLKDSGSAEIVFRNVVLDGGGAGGGIDIGGSETQVVLSGGVIQNCAYGGAGAGILVYADASASLNDWTITGNRADCNGGGLAVAGTNTRVTLYNVNISGNTAGMGDDDVYSTSGAQIIYTVQD